MDDYCDPKKERGTNPKDLVGVTKVQLGLFPAAGKIWGAWGMTNGAAKYGPYNWRANNIIYSIYLDAMERHLLALRDGEDYAVDSGVHHIAHIISNGGILADAIEGEFLVDDRPLPGPATKILERLTIKKN